MAITIPDFRIDRPRGFNKRIQNRKQVFSYLGVSTNVNRLIEAALAGDLAKFNLERKELEEQIIQLVLAVQISEATAPSGD